jgi:hypothetical protein
MTTLTATQTLRRAVLSEVVEDPNTTPTVVVAGTAATTSGNSGTGKVEEIQQEGSFRVYGSGNVRLILGAGKAQTQTLALMAISAADVENVKSLLGHKVLYRDTYGRRVFGAFLDVQIAAIPFSGGLYNLGLVIQTVSHTEAV